MESFKLGFCLTLLLSLLHYNNLQAQVTVYPQGSVSTMLQVHDSISPFAELKLTQGTNTGQGLKLKLYNSGFAEINNRLDDMIFSAGATGPGSYMFMEAFGNIGIGYPKFPATHALHIKDIDPIRLDGLTQNLLYDTILVVSPTGVVHKRANNSFPASYWFKTDNFVYNVADSVGIGLSSPTEKLSVAEGMNIISSSNNARLKLESVFVKSELGQYKFGTSDVLLGGVLPASGLTFLRSKEGSSDVVSSQGLLLEVEGPKPLIFATNDKESMRIDSKGYVGIGTNFPLANLHVKDTIYVDKDVRFSSFNSMGIGEYRAGTRNNQDLHIQAADDIQLVSALNVEIVDNRKFTKPWGVFDQFKHHFGIDTMTPEFSLHINGNASIEDSLLVPKLVFGPENKNLLFSDSGGLTIENNHKFSDSRKNIEISNAYDHFMRMEENQINFIYKSQEYLKFDGKNERLGIDGGTVVPRETLDVGGSAVINDTIIISDYNKFISGKGGALDLVSDEPIKIVAENEQVSISDGIFPYAIFDGKSRRFGLLNSGTPKKKLEVGGSGLIQDTLFIKDENHRLSTSVFGQLNIESVNDIVLSTGATTDVLVKHGGSTYATFDGTNKRLGIHTTTPEEELDVNGTTVSTIVKVTDTLFVNNANHRISETTFGQLEIESANDIVLNTGPTTDVLFQNGTSTYVKFDGTEQRVGILTSSPDEALDVNGTIETNKIKIKDGAIPGRVLISDGDGLGSWGTVPADGDWTVTGVDMQAGVPGNVQIGAGIVQNSKVSLNGSFAAPIFVTIGTSYNISPSNHTVVLTDPSSVTAFLPIANTCPGRIYKIKYMTGGGALNVSTAADLIDGALGSYMIPPPSLGLGTTITIQSDGGNGWWILD